MKAVLATSALILGLASAGAVTPAVAATTSSGAAILSVVPTDQGSLTANSPLELTLTIGDAAGGGLPAGTATVSVNRTPLGSRTALDAWLSDAKGSSTADRQVFQTTSQAIPAGQDQQFRLTVPAASLGFGAPGVYAVAVAVTSGVETLGTARTAVVWQTGSTSPVSVAIAAPLSAPAATTGFIDSATLATYTAPGGVLTRELDDLLGTPVAIGIDPRVIASIRVLGRSAPLTARTWLARLEAAPNETFPLSWGDADLTVALQAGAERVPAVQPLDYAIDPKQFATPPTPSPTPTDTGTIVPSETGTLAPTVPDPSATDNSNPQADPTLPTSADLTAWNYTLPTLSWPADDSVSRSDLAPLRASGYSSLILASDNLKRADSTVPGFAIGATTGIVSDRSASAQLRAATAATSLSQWQSAVAGLTASLAQASLTGSGGGRASLLLTLGRNWVDDGIQLDRAVTSIYSRAWVAQGSLAAQVQGPRTSATLTSMSEKDARVDLVRQLLATQPPIVRFSRAIADSPQTLTSGHRIELLTLLSNAWTADSAGWETASRAFVAESEKILASVQVAKSSTITIPSSQGSVPVIVSNGYAQPITVYVTVRSQSTSLTIDPKYRRVLVTVDANSQRRVQVPVQSLSNGRVRIVIALVAPSGDRVGDRRGIDINVQAGWETAGTLVFGALIIAIFAVGVVRNIRKRRRRGDDTDESDTDTDDPDDTDADARAGRSPGASDG
nr:DUF6049 family protein [Galbitalea soli]